MPGTFAAGDIELQTALPSGWIRGLFVLAILCAIPCSLAEDRTADEAASGTVAGKQPVRLALAKAAAEREAGGIAFECESVMINETGAVLHVKSNCFSAFDGLQLVVFDGDGTRLVQQAYVAHQSPYSPEGRRFPLNVGETRQLLRFPVRVTLDDVKRIGVLLVGTLPGSEHPSVLCSNLVTIPIRGETGDHGPPSAR